MHDDFAHPDHQTWNDQHATWDGHHDHVAGAEDMTTTHEPPIAPLESYSPDLAIPIAGDPASDMGVWHEQEQQDTCAIASQEFVLESLTGHHFDEAELTQVAEQHGWYQPGAGTPVNDMNALLTQYGVPSETHSGGTLDGITEALNSGDKVIVSVDGEELHEAELDQPLDDIQDTIPGQGADHAVEVTGVVETPQGTMVVLNDPRSADGCGCMVSLGQFENAWQDSGNVMIVAGPTADPTQDELASASLREAGA